MTHITNPCHAHFYKPKLFTFQYNILVVQLNYWRLTVSSTVMNKHTHLRVDLVQSQTMLHDNSSEREEGLSSLLEGGGVAETARLGKRVKQGAKCWRACDESLWKLFLTPVNLYQLQTHTHTHTRVTIGTFGTIRYLHMNTSSHTHPSCPLQGRAETEMCAD